MSVVKKIYDPVHGFIRLTEVEALIVDAPVFQRLHDIRQLGVAYLVYPGATHTRFEHSLGVMQVASQIFDQITSKYQGDVPVSLEYWRQIVRLSALCHDLGHLPFSHVSEKRLLGKGGHETWTVKVLESSYLEPLWQKISSTYGQRNPLDDVIRVSLGDKKLAEIDHRLSRAPFSDWEMVMSQVITGDFFGADRIDYLLRDAKCTGVSYGLFDYAQLIEMLTILPCPSTQKLVLGIEENGIESCEALLLARHFMHKRVYQYPSVKAYGFHMSRFMKDLYDKMNPLCDLTSYLSMTDSDILCAIKKEQRLGALSHRDARALFEKGQRYASFEIPHHIEKDEVERRAIHLGIDLESIEWGSFSKSSRGSSFSVLKKNGQICDAIECSELLIAPFSSHLMYVPKELQERVYESLMSQSIDGA